MPALAQFAKEAAPKGVRLVSINVKGTPATVRRLSAGHELPVLLDSTAVVARRYAVLYQPCTVVISGARISARFSGSASHVTLLDALRAATNTTGEPFAVEAGADPRRVEADLVQKGRQWFDGERQVAASNGGRWTTRPDGVYVDPSSGRVLGVATVRGRPAEAFALAEIHAQRTLLAAAEPICHEPSTRPSVEGGGYVPYAQRSGLACLCSTWDTFAWVDGRANEVRVAVFPTGPLVRSDEAFVRRSTRGFSAARHLEDLMPQLRAKLLSNGHALTDPLQ